MKKQRFLAPIFFILLFNFLQAQVIHIPEDYSTIQEGINAAINGDTVLVDTGTYVERINFTGKNIVVASKYITTMDTNYINQTIIDGDSLGSVVSIISGEDSTAVLCGFTVQNGADTVGGGISIIDSSPTIKNSQIASNNVIRMGGGIYMFNSNSHLIDNKIRDNNVYPDVNFSGPHGQGGGVYIMSSGGKITKTLIANNSVYSTEGCNYCGGGGIYTENSNTIFEDLFIFGNYSADYGGGILQLGGSGQQTIVNTQIINNYGWIGGGICFVGSGQQTIVNTQIINNYGWIGGGICFFGNKIWIYNSIIANNTGHNGIENHDGTIYIYNSTVANNEGTGLVMNYGERAYIFNSIFRGHVGDEISGGPSYIYIPIDLYYNNIESFGVSSSYLDPIWHEGNISEDPLFEAYDGFAYFLSNESPCVNVGTPDTSGLKLPESDAAGNPRIYGNRIDMGALENQEVWLGTVNILDQPVKLNLHPNPVSDQLQIKYDLKDGGYLDISITSINGQNPEQLLNEFKPKGQHRFDYDCSPLAPGVYIISFRWNDKVTYQKFVKM